MTDTTTHELTAARLLLGCAERLQEAGMPADAVSRSLFAASFQHAYRVVEPAEVRRQLAAVLAELERDDSHD
jgi:hypothetical protein